MNTKRIAVIGITLAALASAPASAAAPGNQNVRCLMLSNVFVTAAKDDRGKQEASAIRLFYLGRIPDGMTEPQLETVMLAEGKSIAPATAGAEMNKCAQLFVLRTKAMKEISEKLRQQLAAKKAP